MLWKPAKALGLCAGLVLALAIIGIDIVLVDSLTRQSLGIGFYISGLALVLSIPALAFWAYWYVSLATLRYHLDRNALEIISANSRRTIPMGKIQRIVPGVQLGELGAFQGVAWPGYQIGRVQTSDLGTLQIHGTEPLERQLVVVTDAGSYGISPRDPASFYEDWAARRSLGAMREATFGLVRENLAASAVWRDRALWSLVILAFLANAGLFGFILAQYGNLPQRIPLHFGAEGIVDRIAERASLLFVPTIGTLTWSANLALGVLLHKGLTRRALLC